MKSLTVRQKAVLIQLARKAFNHEAATAASRGLPFDTSRAGFDAWRHEQVQAACGRPGLRACGNVHYNSIAARFESLAGRDDRALNHLLRGQTEDRRQAEHVLRRILAKGDYPSEYADSIALDRWGCLVEDTTDAQLWQLIYTIQNRVTAKGKRAREAARNAATPEGPLPAGLAGQEGCADA